MTVFASVAAGHVAEATEMREAIPMKTNFMFGLSGFVRLFNVKFLIFFIQMSLMSTILSITNSKTFMVGKYFYL